MAAEAHQAADRASLAAKTIAVDDKQAGAVSPTPALDSKHAKAFASTLDVKQTKQFQVSTAEVKAVEEAETDPLFRWLTKVTEVPLSQKLKAKLKEEEVDLKVLRALSRRELTQLGFKLGSCTKIELAWEKEVQSASTKKNKLAPKRSKEV